MTVISLCSAPTLTGRVALIAGLTAGLAQSGLETRLFLDTCRAGDLSDWCAQRGVPVDRSLNLSTVAWPGAYVRDLWRLAAILRRLRPQAILAAESNDLLLAVAARKLARWRVPIAAYAPETPRRSMARLPDAWIRPALTSQNLDTIPGFSGALLPTGPLVDPLRFCPVASAARQRLREGFGFASDDRVIGWVGRVKAGRGWDRLLAALRSCQENKLKLLLVGFGEDLPYARWWATRAGLAGRVVFAGFRGADLPDCYRAMDALILPETGRDGLGRAGLEALACGLPLWVADSAFWRAVAAHAPGVTLLNGSTDGLAEVFMTVAASPALEQSAASWVAAHALDGVRALHDWLKICANPE
jgi:glycosyltransferase involved in cell wall biosynthesis